MDLATLVQKVLQAYAAWKAEDYTEVLKIVVELALELGKALVPQPMFANHIMESAYTSAANLPLDELFEQLKDECEAMGAVPPGVTAAGPLVDKLMPILKAVIEKLLPYIFRF